MSKAPTFTGLGQLTKCRLRSSYAGGGLAWYWNCFYVTQATTPPFNETETLVARLLFVQGFVAATSAFPYFPKDTRPWDNFTLTGLTQVRFINPNPTPTPTPTPTVNASPTPTPTLTPTVTPTPSRAPALVYSSSYIPFEITNAGFSYNVSQIGTANPPLTCFRGTNYDFIIQTASHPFALRTSHLNTSPVSGTYNNDTVSGKTSGSRILFTPNSNTPSTIIYQCTIHSHMSGAIAIKDYSL